MRADSPPALQLASGAGVTLLLPQTWAQPSASPTPAGPDVPLQANEPWRVAGKTPGDWRLRALSYALLAPNPHNLQPWLIEANTPRTHKESVDLTRIGSTEVIVQPNGISLGAPMFDRMKAEGQINREAMLDPSSPANQMGKQRYAAMMKATPAMLWMGSLDNSRSS